MTEEEIRKDTQNKIVAYLWENFKEMTKDAGDGIEESITDGYLMAIEDAKLFGGDNGGNQ